ELADLLRVFRRDLRSELGEHAADELAHVCKRRHDLLLGPVVQAAGPELVVLVEALVLALRQVVAAPDEPFLEGAELLVAVDGRLLVLGPHLLPRHLDAAALADDALVADALVLAAIALPVLRRTEDALAEEPVTLGLERPVVDRLRLRHLTVRPVPDLLCRREADADRVELVDVDLCHVSRALFQSVVTSWVTLRSRRPQGRARAALRLP